MYIYEKKGRYVIDFQDIPSKRAEMPEISVEERQGNFKEVETGFPEDVAVAEAKRCLSCRRCLGCALCWAECKPEAINFDMPDEDFDLAFDKVILTSGMQRRVAPISGNVGNKHMNVVTDLQVERMLADDTGPSNGLIMRPQDGEIPKKICFVQSFGAGDDKVRDATLIFGVNEAILAQKKIDGAQISFISPDMDAFKGSAGGDLDKVSGVNFINGTVIEVAETGEDKNIEVKYDDGGEKTETFDLVVLLTQPQVPPSVEDAAKKLGVDVSYASFLDKPGEMVETDKPGVVLAQNV